MMSNPKSEELLPAAADCAAGVRLEKSKEINIINRLGRSTHPKEKSVSRSGATPFHVPTVSANTLKPILQNQIAQSARLMTDGARIYKKIGKHFVSHESVNHYLSEYARGDVTINSAESFFSVLKRGIVGIYQHVSEQHLSRYGDEFAFRHSNRSSVGVDDSERAENLLKGIEGKRLTYNALIGRDIPSNEPNA